MFAGDKICKMLEERLVEHVALYGTTEPVPQPGEEEDDTPPAPRARKTAAEKRGIGAGKID